MVKFVGHPDYNFRIDGHNKFFIEAKAQHEPLHKMNHVLQAKSYTRNTQNGFIVLLTDFEEFCLFDTTIKPDSGYTFTGWTEEVSSGHENDNPVSITMDGNKSIKASFTALSNPVI